VIALVQKVYTFAAEAPSIGRKGITSVAEAYLFVPKETPFAPIVHAFVARGIPSVPKAFAFAAKGNAFV